MGRAKPKPPDAPLENRLVKGKEKTKEKPKKAKQGYLAITNDDGTEAETLAPSSIPEINEAAEAYRVKKEERKNKTLELKVQEDQYYETLKSVMTKHLPSLGPSKIYRYTDDDDVVREVEFEEPGVTVRKAKTEEKDASGFGDGEEPEELE